MGRFVIFTKSAFDRLDKIFGECGSRAAVGCCGVMWGDVGCCGVMWGVPGLSQAGVVVVVHAGVPD
jgi:hypothetical protein